MSSWGKKLFERGKNRVIFKSSKREKKRNLSYTGIKIYQLGFRRVILSTSFLPPTLPEKFFTPPIVRNIPEEGRTTFEFEFRKLELFEITLYKIWFHIHNPYSQKVIFLHTHESWPLTVINCVKKKIDPGNSGFDMGDW